MLLSFCFLWLTITITIPPKQCGKVQRQCLKWDIWVFHLPRLVSHQQLALMGDERRGRALGVKLETILGWRATTSTPVKSWKVAPVMQSLLHRKRRTRKATLEVALGITGRLSLRLCQSRQVSERMHPLGRVVFDIALYPHVLKAL